MRAILVTAVVMLVGCSSSSTPSQHVGPRVVFVRPSSGFAAFAVSSEPEEAGVVCEDAMLGHTLNLEMPPLVVASQVTEWTLHQAPGQYPFLVLQLNTETIDAFRSAGINTASELAAEIDGKIVSGNCVTYDGKHELTIRSGIGGPDLLAILANR